MSHRMCYVNCAMQLCLADYAYNPVRAYNDGSSVTLLEQDISATSKDGRPIKLVCNFSLNPQVGRVCQLADSSMLGLF